MKTVAMTSLVTLGLFALFVPSIVRTQTAVAKETLVLLDSEDLKATHSLFFQTLADSGYKLHFKLADDAGLSLRKHGVWLYEHLVVFAPATEEFGGDLSPETIAEFVDNGGNLLVGASPEAGDAIRDLAAEFGMEIDDPGTKIIDHTNFVQTLDNGHHTTIAIPPDHLIPAPAIVGPRNVGPILYEGANLLLDPENPLVLEILTAPPTAYAYHPEKPLTEQPKAIGVKCVGLAGLQARNNARVVFSGSLDLFSDAFLTAKDFGNREVVRALSGWVFKERGVLRLSNVSHHKEGESHPPADYTITENLVYRVTLEELSPAGQWGPLVADDVQLDFVRIDCFVRVPLRPISKGSAVYEAKFKVPDVYGVFQLKVDYTRKGLTFLSSATQVSVRPLQHKQYERFIPSAYPYYAAAFSMMLGLVTFSFVFLHFREKDKSD